MWSEVLLEILLAARITGSCDTVPSQGPEDFWSVIPSFVVSWVLVISSSSILMGLEVWTAEG